MEGDHISTVESCASIIMSTIVYSIRMSVASSFAEVGNQGFIIASV